MVDMIKSLADDTGRRKFSAILYERTWPLWAESAEKNFVRSMADGTLAPERFRVYMLQDYLYLHDYIDILKRILGYAENSGLQDFLNSVIRETENELYRMHIPSMKRIGIDEEEIGNCAMMPEFRNYIDYMREQLDDKGLLAGLTALLQCSWNYAYVAQLLTERYPDEIAASPYRNWFTAYTCADYIMANQNWIDVLDAKTADISGEDAEDLARIFETCAKYENSLWDALQRTSGVRGV